MAVSGTIGFLGGGAMAEALLAGILRAGLKSPGDLYVTDVQEERLAYLQHKFNINTSNDNAEVVGKADMLVLAVKPRVLPVVLKEVGGKIKPGQVVVSIAAGITTRFIEKYLDENVPVVRVMPNTPCLIGEGAAAIAGGKNARPGDLQQVEQLLAPVGIALKVEEYLMDAVTGLSGSGPAYIYLVAEAMADGGVRMGLPRDIALKLAAQTMLGAAKMILETGEHPARLKDNVVTPGGTTIEGLFALEEAGIRSAFMEAVENAARRSKELSGGLE